MSYKLENYNEVIEKLYPYLEDYLQEQGIDTSKNFSCIDPKHNDSDPSMGLVPPDKHVFKCFGCGATGGIFNAVGYLEGKATSGPDFLSDTIPYLAEKYGIALNFEPLTEEEQYEFDTYRAYRTAAEIIGNGKRHDSFTQEIKRRGWDNPTVTSFGLGCVENYAKFRETLKNSGLSAGFIDDIDLGRKELFGNDRLIFPIRDPHGRTVGFASRNLSYDGNKKNGSKYVNQKSTGVKCNIYKKSERLFGLDLLLKEGVGKSTPIYLFEGYGDVITAHQHGVTNSVGIGGTALTREQVEVLKESGYYNIALCLDGDAAGQKRTAEILDNVLGEHKDLRVSIVMLPMQQDPDDFIRTEGADKFLKLKRWSAFEWRLARFPENTETKTICDAMIPLIMNEPSFIAQEEMCITLAKETGVTLKTIQAELDRMQNKREKERDRDRQNVISRMVRDLDHNRDNAEQIIQSAEHSLFELDRKYAEDAMSEDSLIAIIESTKLQEEEKDGSFAGFVLDSDLGNIQEALAGNWKNATWFCLGGKPNSGKTSLMCKIMYSIANNAEDNNACVIYHSIDDSVGQVLPKFICLANGTRDLEINHVIDPKYYASQLGEYQSQTLYDSREIGYNKIKQLVRDGRLVIKDASAGTSLAFAENLIKYYKKKYPQRNIVYVLDNFHKLRDFNDAKKGDERARFKEISTVLKNMCVKHNCLIMSTVEYRKTKDGERPGNSDIGETGQIEYDANIIAHVYNEVHDKPDKAELWHSRNESGERLPTIELNIAKNKVSSFKGKLYLDFYPACSDFMGVSNGTVAERVARVKEALSKDEESLYTEFKSMVQDALDRNYKPGKACYAYLEQFGDWPSQSLKDKASKEFNISFSSGGNGSSSQSASVSLPPM